MACQPGGGNGSQGNVLFPVQVSLPGPARQLGAGPDFACALLGDSVYCWGHNNQGQVGIGVPPTTTTAASTSAG